MEAALEAGADDVVASDDGSIEVVCAPAVFDRVKAGLARAGLRPDAAEVTMKPVNDAALAGGGAAKLRGLLEALENLDDVQDVYTTATLDEA